jgi:hypothetical protein
MQLIQLDCFGRGRQPIESQPMEIERSSASGLQEALNGTRRDITDISSGLDGATVREALDEANHSNGGKPGILQKGSLVLAETLSAMVTVQAADIMVFAAFFDHAEIVGGEEVEPWAIGVGTSDTIKGFGRNSEGRLAWRFVDHGGFPSGTRASPALFPANRAAHRPFSSIFFAPIVRVYPFFRVFVIGFFMVVVPPE